ncbi:MAG: cupin domain-containing protein [Actinobacteria bacterium]|nr:MAG: cupin domain-containing protein [Actinomycetota bacterium]
MRRRRLRYGLIAAAATATAAAARIDDHEHDGENGEGDHGCADPERLAGKRHVFTPLSPVDTEGAARRFLASRVHAVTVPEAPLRQTKFGLAPEGSGWFVVNAGEIRWRRWERLGVYCDFEGKRRFPQLGVNISVLQPGESLGRYHAENAQEDFLVVSGRCVVVVEDEERELRAWDFFHSPPGTRHMIVGAGDGPSVVVAVGARGRGRKGLVYPPSRVAAKHGISVAQETNNPSEAYADLERPKRVTYEDGWLPGL